jgi:hypothetical protein
MYQAAVPVIVRKNDVAPCQSRALYGQGPAPSSLHPDEAPALSAPAEHRLARLLTLWVLREALFRRHTDPKSVERLPKVRETTEAIAGVGVLPRTLRVFELADRVLPALA